MIVISAIITFILGICIYMFYRAESLQKQVSLFQREIKSTNIDNQNLIDTIAIITLKNEEIANKRLQSITEKNTELSDMVVIVTPFIKNYSLIIRETIKGNGQLTPVVKKLYDGVDKNAYKEFVNYINQQEASVRRLWSSNNMPGYISLVDTLFVLLEELTIKTDPENKKAS